MPTYHCRVESVALGEVGLSSSSTTTGGGGGGFGRLVGKKGPVVRTTEALSSSPGKAAKQPWKTLGIDPPEGREH